VRCSIKASDGLLYPLAKSFIFINKPTVIIAYEDIEFIEFKRYEPVANSASRSFGTQEAHS
jgi:structure-specific recognition protein 1